MVDKYSAYAIINKSVLQVANELVVLDVLDVEDKKAYVRLEETPFSIAERQERLNGGVVVAHNINQYVNRFYTIELTEDNVPWISHLVQLRLDEIDLTEFGEFL